MQNEIGAQEEVKSPNVIKRLIRDIKGVTAIEFAILGAPFLILIFAIIESSILFFSSQYLETAVDNVTRKIRTGVLNELTTEAQFKSALCDEIVVLFTCSQIKTNVDVAATFDQLTPSQANDDGEIDEGFDPLGPKKIIQVTATYQWPVFTNYATPLRFGNTNSALIHVTSVTRTEPFLLQPK